MSRSSRSSEHRAIKELNDISERLRWIRVKLKLSITGAASGSGIPYATYYDRENGARTDRVEEYQAMANYFNTRWQERFTVEYPDYQGEKLSKITPMFIMFGEIDSEKAEVEKIKQVLIKTQMDAFSREQELNRQISVLSEGIINPPGLGWFEVKQ